MKTKIRNIVKQIFPKWYWQRLTYQQLIRNPKSFLHTSGWYQSYVQQQPQKADGSVLPWMNYALIDFLDERLQNHFSLFEYGSGASTLYFAQKVANVVSVEYDMYWYSQVKATMPTNVQLLYCDYFENNQTYIHSITESGQLYHIVLIDGRDRLQCMQQAASCLHENGVLILDDSEREKYDAAFATSVLMGFKHLTFRSFKPCGVQLVATTIFYKTDNCLGI